MNVFNIINQYNKNTYTTYGDILNNDSNSKSNLSNTERDLYEQYKLGDIQRFKMNENHNLINNGGSSINHQQQEIPGIGIVTQIC